MSATRRLDPTYWRDLWGSADPGFVRLYVGGRATLAAGGAALVLAALAHRFHLPSTGVMAGVVIAMTSMVAVTDPEPRRQQVTHLWLPLPSGAALTLGTLVAGSPWWSGLALLLTIFSAVYVRRFGPRGFALGMVGFMSFFFALFFRAQPAQLPWIVGGIVIAVAWGFVVRFGVMRDLPTLRPRVVALRARASLVLLHLAEAICGPWTPRVQKRIRLRLTLLNDAALEFEELLEGRALRRADGGVDVSEIHLRIFELELSVERIVEAVQRISGTASVPEACKRRLGELLRAARAVIRQPSAEARARVEREAEALEREIGEASWGPEGSAEVRRLLGAVGDLVEAGERSQRLAAVWLGSREEAPGETAPPGTTGAAPARTEGLALSTRQAIQATIAGGLAMAAGEWVSPVRWYWAVLSAFVVFIKATTVGETLVRAWHRILGTGLGVLAGLIVARAVSGEKRLELALIFLCIFFGYYLLRVSYVWMVTWITALLALLYMILGRFTPGLLLLRVEETMVGAGIGGLVAAVVLPSRSREKVRENALEVLRLLGRHLPKLVAGGPEAGAPAVREMDRALRELRTATKPLQGRLQAGRAHALLRLAYAVSGLVFYARLLASRSREDGAEASAEKALEAFAQRLAARAAAIASGAGGASGRETPPAEESLTETVPERLEERGGPESRLAVRAWLGRMDQLLREAGEVLTSAQNASRPGRRVLTG